MLNLVFSSKCCHAHVQPRTMSSEHVNRVAKLILYFQLTDVLLGTFLSCRTPGEFCFVSDNHILSSYMIGSSQ